MKQYSLFYDKFIKDHVVKSKNGRLASIGYLCNRNNHRAWKDDILIEYKNMLQWLKENYPEWII